MPEIHLSPKIWFAAWIVAALPIVASGESGLIRNARVVGLTADTLGADNQPKSDGSDLRSSKGREAHESQG